MNLLITGGCGFIGSNAIHHLIDRPEITLLVNLDGLTYAANPANLGVIPAHPKYRFEPTDLRDRAATAAVVARHGITHVLHLAAESHVDRSIAAPEIFLQTNVLGTFHLLEACRAAWAGHFRSRRFLHVSTDEVYGDLAPGAAAFTESSAYAPSSPYSASKAAADHLVRACHRTYEFPALITNCGNNFGPGQHAEKLIPLIIDRVRRRQCVPLYGDGQQVRDWIFVRDHVEALWQVLTRGRVGETYHLGARCERTNCEIAERLCDLVDELAPELGGNSRALISHVADRPGHDRRYAIDPTKVESELGWKAQTNFDDALRETVRWFLQSVGNS